MGSVPIQIIIEQCISLDKHAQLLYESFKSIYSPDLSVVWGTLANQERVHVHFWERLYQVSKNNMLPDIFDDPEQVISNLARIENKFASMPKPCSSMTLNQAFMQAYTIEFYLLNPAFQRLFFYDKSVSRQGNPIDSYDNHIDKLLNAMHNHYCTTGQELEMELLAESIKNLWKSNRQLAFSSMYDELTGVLNRRGFFDTVQPLASLAHRNSMLTSVIIADIDNFKKVNDTLGHQTGDKVLQAVGAALRDNVRGSDIIGRYGGEEFIVFLPELHEAGAGAAAEKLRIAVEQASGAKVQVTASFGAATGLLSNTVQKSLLELIKQADQCLYEAKRTGKNKVVEIRVQ